MQEANHDPKPGWKSFPLYCLAWCMASRTIRWGLILAMVISLFYLEENWRGRRAWKNYLTEQAAKGVGLDWSGKSPPTIPDAENFYQAKGMANWFLKPLSGAPGSPINFSTPPALPLNRHAKIMVEVLPLRANKTVAPTNTAAVLDYDPPLLRLLPTAGTQDVPSADGDTNNIPLIQFESVALLTAVENLARQAGLNYILDPRIPYGAPGPDGKPQPQPLITVRWADLTATQALRSLLRAYCLVWAPDQTSGVGRIVMGDPIQPPFVLNPGVRPRLEELFRDAFGPFIRGSQGIWLFNRPIEDAPPVRLAIRQQAHFGAAELGFLTSEQPLSYGEGLLKGLTIEAAPDDWLFAVMRPSQACTTADYLAWSDGYAADFDRMRDALKRPQAVPPGSYWDASGMPAENSVAVRTVTQTLAQRSQCQLLLGQPEQALRELTLLNDLRRIFHGPPTNRPMPAVNAMIDVVLAGMYAGVVEDGLRLQAWQEPQLIALQAQLAEVNLIPILARAHADEPAINCRALEKLTPEELLPAAAVPPQAWPQRLKNPHYLFLKLAPRGWVYLNLVNVAEMMRRYNDVFDPTGQFVVPHQVNKCNQDIQALLARFSPGTALASFAMPISVRDYQNTLFTQTRINQLALACALERHRLARGRYPDSLEALAPEFIPVLPRDIINRQPLHYSRIPDRGYQIYSVGWDEKDDRGLPCGGGAWGNGIATLDWVWRFPAN